MKVIGIICTVLAAVIIGGVICCLCAADMDDFEEGENNETDNESP